MFTMHLFVLFLSLYKSIITFDRYFVSFFFFLKKKLVIQFMKIRYYQLYFFFKLVAWFCEQCPNTKLTKFFFNMYFFFLMLGWNFRWLPSRSSCPHWSRLNSHHFSTRSGPLSTTASPLPVFIQDCSHPFSCLLVIVVFVILTSLW